MKSLLRISKRIIKRLVPPKLLSKYKKLTFAKKYPVTKRRAHPERIAFDVIYPYCRKTNDTKIIFVGLKADYDDELRGMSFEYYNFFLPLIEMGMVAKIFDPYELSRKWGRTTTSKALWEAVGQFQPHFVFYFHYLDVIEYEIWRKISSISSCSSIIWLADDHWRHEETAVLEKNFNLIVTTWKDGLTLLGREGKAFLGQWGVNSGLFRDLGLQRDLDVSFIGQRYGEREKYINALRKAGIKVQVFGTGWPNSHRLNQFEMIEALNKSKMVLNFADASHSGIKQIKARPFEATACGACLLTEYSEGIEEFFQPGSEVVCFRTLDEMVDKAKYYLNQEKERGEIARAGKARSVREHDIKARLQKILDRALELKEGSKPD